MVTDFHSHILPGIDDGSGSVDESVELLRLEAAQQVERIVLTPHFYAHHDSPDRFLKRRERAMEELRGATAGQRLPALYLGAEVSYFRGMSSSDALRELTIGGTNHILVEMPMGRWTGEMYRELGDISYRQGLTPIVAHIDRYIAPFAAHGIPERLAELPVLVQANGTFFLKRTTSHMAMRLLKDGLIHVIGSDCHNLTDRTPNLGSVRKAVERRLGEGALGWIRRNESDILGDLYENGQKTE